MCVACGKRGSYNFFQARCLKDIAAVGYAAFVVLLVSKDV